MEELRGRGDFYLQVSFLSELRKKAVLIDWNSKHLSPLFSSDHLSVCKSQYIPTSGYVLGPALWPWRINGEENKSPGDQFLVNKQLGRVVLGVLFCLFVLAKPSGQTLG